MIRSLLDRLRRVRGTGASATTNPAEQITHALPGNEGKVLRLHGFWPGADSDEPLIALLGQLVSKRAQAYQAVCVASVFAPPPPDRRGDTLYVQFSGESRFHDPALFDVNLIPAKAGPKIVPMPYMAFEYLWNPKIARRCAVRAGSQTELRSRKFCLFVVSNAASRERLDFFKRLSAHMPVDSFGAVLNNQGGRRPVGQRGDDSYLDLIGQYRYMICFENCRADGYLTEKLMNAYAGGAGPIYWGCPQISNWVNPSAVLEIDGEYTAASANNLVQRVLDLESRPEEYRRIHAQPLFAGGTVPAAFDLQQVITQIAACR
jgi:hypothetical protein